MRFRTAVLAMSLAATLSPSLQGQTGVVAGRVWAAHHGFDFGLVHSTCGTGWFRCEGGIGLSLIEMGLKPGYFIDPETKTKVFLGSTQVHPDSARAPRRIGLNLRAMVTVRSVVGIGVGYAGGRHSSIGGVWSVRLPPVSGIAVYGYGHVRPGRRPVTAFGVRWGR